MRPGRFVVAALIAMMAAPSARAETAAAPSQTPAEPTYRTMCVRTCDGFYFPIHTYTTQSSLANDAKACQSACSSPVELYFFPTYGAPLATMTNFKGQSYADHPKAFEFRKKISAQCTCKPPAWSPEEKARHAEFARLEEIELEKDRAFIAARADAEAAAKRVAAQPKAEVGQIREPASVENDGAEPRIEPAAAPADRQKPRGAYSLARGETDYDFTRLRRPQRSYRIVQRAQAKPLSGLFAAW